MSAEVASPWRDVFRSGVKFLVWVCGLWAVFFALYVALPYTRSGADIIHDAKSRRMNESGSANLFTAGARERVLVMGNSKVLAGFKPALFDRLVGDGVSSFNAGLPGDDAFLPTLESVLKGPNPPTTILLTMPWADANTPRKGKTFDTKVLDAVFPFHHLPRDLALFAMRAGSRGGLRAYYRQGSRSVDEMLAAGGYYFIEGQSHFASSKLPVDFRLDSDTPSVARPRFADPKSSECLRLNVMLNAHHAKAYYVPIYLREAEAAPAAASNEAWSTALRERGQVESVGPDYWRLPNDLFADPIHLNPAGADVYTARLANLVSPLLHRTP